MQKQIHFPNEILMDERLNNKTKNILLLLYMMKNNKYEVFMTTKDIANSTDIAWPQHVSSYLKKSHQYVDTSKIITSSGKRNVYKLILHPNDNFTRISMELYKKYRKNSDLIINYLKVKFVHFLATKNGTREADIEDYIIIGHWTYEEFIGTINVLQYFGLIKSSLSIEFLQENINCIGYLVDEE